jgi:hypothetical protein
MNQQSFPNHSHLQGTTFPIHEPQPLVNHFRGKCFCEKMFETAKVNVYLVTAVDSLKSREQVASIQILQVQVQIQHHNKHTDLPRSIE